MVSVNLEDEFGVVVEHVLGDQFMEVTVFVEEGLAIDNGGFWGRESSPVHMECGWVGAAGVHNKGKFEVPGIGLGGWGESNPFPWAKETKVEFKISWSVRVNTGELKLSKLARARAASALAAGTWFLNSLASSSTLSLHSPVAALRQWDKLLKIVFLMLTFSVRGASTGSLVFTVFHSLESRTGWFPDQ